MYLLQIIETGPGAQQTPYSNGTGCSFPGVNWLELQVNCSISFSTSMNGDRGSTAVKVLCYKSEVRWFDPSWCHLIFNDIILPIAL